MSDTRPGAQLWANYPGDCRSILEQGPKGPNTWGEPMWPVTAEFDGESTRVGFSYVSPPEFAAKRWASFVAHRQAVEAGFVHVSGLASEYLALATSLRTEEDS